MKGIDDMINSKGDAIAAINGDAEVFNKLPEFLQNDRELILLAISKQKVEDPLDINFKPYDSPLAYVTNEDLLDDKEVVIAAVMKRHAAYHFASPRLKKDRDAIFEAINGQIFDNFLKKINGELQKFGIY